MTIKEHYEALLQEHGDSHLSAQYSSRESQEVRFRILADIADLNGKRILDFGCGTGHLATYLKANGVSCEYTGVDIVPGFFPVAREKNPEARFGLMEEFRWETFDYAFVSGVFNNRMDHNEAFYQQTVRQLLDMVTGGLAFNMMSTYVDYQDEGLYYEDPLKAFAFVKALTPFVTLRHDYLVKPNSIPFEFAIYAYKGCTVHSG